MNEEKFSDDDWKEQANKEKETLIGRAAEADESVSDDLEMNFLNYILSLGFQAMVFLGEIANPVTGQQEKNLPQAKMLIDTLIMLKNKTKGNLDAQEDSVLQSSVYELEMKYVELANAEGKKVIDG